MADVPVTLEKHDNRPLNRILAHAWQHADMLG
jgi:hypothetical protein